MNLVGQVSGCLRSSGRELWTPFLGQAWLIPRPGAGASLDLEREAASPKGPDLAFWKLCPAWLSPSGTWGHPACNYVLWQGAPVKEQRKGLINHRVSLAHSAGSLSPVVAERIGLNFEILPPTLPPIFGEQPLLFPEERKVASGAFYLPGFLTVLLLMFLLLASCPSASHNPELARVFHLFARMTWVKKW